MTKYLEEKELEESVTIDDGGGSITIDGSVSIIGAAGDGAILDGVNATIKATVLDLTNSNPLAVRLSDTNGDYVAAGGGTQYTEDVAAAADPIGTMQMAVRLDSLAAITSTDGDNIAVRATNKGEQYVKHVDAIPVTDNAGSLTVDGTVTIQDGGNVISVDDAAGSLTVDSTQLPAALVGGRLDVVVGAALPTGGNNIGDVDVLTMPVVAVKGAEAHDAPITLDPVLVAFKASAAAPADVSADNDVARGWALRNGSQVVNLASGGTLIPGTANGLGVQQATASNFNAQVVGELAHDAVDSGNPQKIGAMAKNALPAAVANSDRTNLIADLFGRLMVCAIDPAQAVHKAVSVTTTQTGTDVWTPAGGKRIAVTSVIVSSFGTTAARVILWFGDNADTTYTAGTDQVLVAASFAPSATVKPGLVYTPAVPIFCTTADRELHLTTDAGISLDITVEGYEY